MSRTYSTPGTATYSVTFDNLDQMMSVFPDNNDNLISARDVRDAVLTLYWQTEDLGASFSATSSQFLYTNTSPSTVTVGGIVAGTTFSNRTLQQMFDDMFYPYTAPSCSISASNPSREFGSSNATTLTWSVTKAKLPITSIVVDGLSVVPSGNNQSGTKAGTVVQNVNTSFTISVGDGTSTISSSTTVSWFNAVYWGKTPTFTTPSMVVVGSQPTWADGAGVGSGKALASSRSRNYAGINGSGQYLVFAWPTSFPGVPTFTINGLPNTAFTKLGNAVPFTNRFGYTINYDVWVSNTAQNSPIASFVIS